MPETCARQLAGHALWRRDAGIRANWARLGLHAALRVPSSFVLGEFTYLLNPAHPDFDRITIARPESFDFDSRLHR